MSPLQPEDVKNSKTGSTFCSTLVLIWVNILIENVGSNCSPLVNVELKPWFNLLFNQVYKTPTQPEFEGRPHLPSWSTSFIPGLQGHHQIDNHMFFEYVDGYIHQVYQKSNHQNTVFKTKSLSTWKATSSKCGRWKRLFLTVAPHFRWRGRRCPRGHRSKETGNGMVTPRSMEKWLGKMLKRLVVFKKWLENSENGKMVQIESWNSDSFSFSWKIPSAFQKWVCTSLVGSSLWPHPDICRVTQRVQWQARVRTSPGAPKLTRWNLMKPTHMIFFCNFTWNHPNSAKHLSR